MPEDLDAPDATSSPVPEPSPTPSAKVEPDTGGGDEEPVKEVEHQGQRLVPTAALQKERAKRQEFAKKARELEARVAELESVKQNWQAIEPYLPLVAEALERHRGGSTPAPAAGEDAEALAFAQEIGIVNAQGEPDVKRARALLNRIDQQAERRARALVAPAATTAAATQAAMLRERAYQVTDSGGRPYAKREHLDAVLSTIPVELQADPNVMRLALVIARGLDTSPPATEPLVTEGPGGSRRGGAALSPIEQAAAAARGIDPQQWVKLRDAKGDRLED